jgi:hypothetical protein
MTMLIIQQLAGELLEGHQLIVPDIVAIAFREPVDEERPLADPQQDQSAEAAGLSAALARDTLLDHTAAEIGIDQAPLDIRHRLPQIGIRDAHRARKARERLVPEYPHAP